MLRGGGLPARCRRLMTWLSNQPHEWPTRLPMYYLQGVPVATQQRRSSLLVRSPRGVPLWHERDERAGADDVDVMVNLPHVTFTTLPRGTPRPTPITFVRDAVITIDTIPTHIPHAIALQTAPAIIFMVTDPITIASASVPPGIPITISRVTKPHNDVTTAAHIIAIALPDITNMPAIVKTTVPLSPVSVAGDVVFLASMLGTSGSADGGGVQDEVAAAPTTTRAASVFIARSPTTPSIVRPFVSSSSWAMLIDNRDGAIRVDSSSLLQMVISLMDNFSMRGSGGVSGVALGVSRITAHIPHPPTAAGCRSARRSGGRPATSVKIHLTATPPRPAPASLLPSSMRPQRGRIAPGRGRVGRSLRADEKAANRRCTTDDGHISESATVFVAVAIQE